MDSSLFNKKRQFLHQRIRHAMRGFLTEYETPKIVAIHSLSYTLLLRAMQVIILIYSILYLLIYEQGYQKSDTSIISSVTLKVKGVGYIHTEYNNKIVIDVADYIVPPSENNAIFIMTNFIRTDQSRSLCSESANLKEAVCQRDFDCQNRPYIPNVSGRWTGRCLLDHSTTTTTTTTISNETNNMTRRSTGLCEMEGWCPAETDTQKPMLIQEVLNFTIFVKNFVEFPAFEVKHKNMVDNLKPCIYHPKEQKDCPIFTMNHIIREAEKDSEELALMLRFGGVIRMKIEWDCNLDRHLRYCKPVYSFARLDVPYRERPFSVGYNFRFASQWKQNGTDVRTLTKAYGLRLIIAVSGKAGRFHFITLTLNTGSLVGIFGLATFLCDIILLHLSNRSRFYRSRVFENVYFRRDSTKEATVAKSSFQTCVDKDSIDIDSRDTATPSISSTSYGTPDPPEIARAKTIVARPLALIDSRRTLENRYV